MGFGAIAKQGCAEVEGIGYTVIHPLSAEPWVIHYHVGRDTITVGNYCR